MTQASAFAIAVLAFSNSALAQGTWRGEQTRRGDTLIVKTISGSVLRDTLRLTPEVAIGSADGAEELLFGRIASIDVDKAGNIFVLDAQAFEVRMFSPSGQFIRKFGRRGSGPGEFERPQNIHILDDGRLIVRDNVRYAIFTTDGRYVGGWNLSSGFSTNAEFFVSGDRVLGPVRGGYLWYKTDGTPLDTVHPPRRMPAAPMLEWISPSGNGSGAQAIPYMPFTVWTVSKDGHSISARGDRYEIDVEQANKRVMRIVRDVTPVPVPAAEAARRREQTLQNIRRNNNPAFEWNGPPIPRTKPFMTRLFSGIDGTLWILRSTPSVERKIEDPDVARRTGQSTEWVSATVLDGFDARGHFLGTVLLPDNAEAYQTPILSATQVWAVSTHPDGYPQIVRYRVRAVVSEGR